MTDDETKAVAELTELIKDVSELDKKKKRELRAKVLAVLETDPTRPLEALGKAGCELQRFKNSLEGTEKDTNGEPKLTEAQETEFSLLVTKHFGADHKIYSICTNILAKERYFIGKEILPQKYADTYWQLQEKFYNREGVSRKGNEEEQALWSDRFNAILGKIENNRTFYGRLAKDMEHDSIVEYAREHPNRADQEPHLPPIDLDAVAPAIDLPKMLPRRPSKGKNK